MVQNRCPRGQPPLVPACRSMRDSVRGTHLTSSPSFDTMQQTANNQCVPLLVLTTTLQAHSRRAEGACSSRGAHTGHVPLTETLDGQSCSNTGTHEAHHAAAASSRSVGTA
jgi:hypothetical protein